MSPVSPSSRAGTLAAPRTETPHAPVHAPRGGTRRHRGEHNPLDDDKEDRWLLTYADMITLLLVLFIVLFALSTISASKFRSLRQGLTSAFNPSAISTPGSNGLLNQPSLSPANTNQTFNPPALSAASSAEMSNIAKAIEVALAGRNLDSYASVSSTTQGVVVQILADKVFFASDAADLGRVGDTIVDTIAGAIDRYPNAVRVEGYTDNQPITGGPYTSNWELSADRAANVANRLDVVDHIAETRLSSVGYGDTHPLASNATPTSRAKNRRIDVVVLGQ